jgi:hypothetical protein
MHGTILRHFGKLPIVLKRIGITNEDELKNLINFSVIILWIIQPRLSLAFPPYQFPVHSYELYAI